MYFVSLAAWLSFRHAKLTAGGEGRVRILLIECVSFFPHPTALAFSQDQMHTLTQTRKVRRHVERPKRDREQFASVNLWITDRYRLMFDSGCSFSLKNDLMMMFFSLIYFFAPFSIFYIPHNYVILQTMPHAIPQTRSAFYPHRIWYTLISRNWKELATMSCNNIIITILKIFPTKKMKSKC